MKRALLILVILTGLILIFVNCEKKVYVVEPDTTPPSSPKGVYSVTGDQAIYIYWEKNDERDFYRYKIYWAPETDGIIPEPDGDFQPITSIGNPPQYTDTDVSNGKTYYYIITAVDYSGNESGNSRLIYDTPRPEGHNVVLYDMAVDPFLAGFTFDSRTVVPWNSSVCDIYLDKVSGTFYLNTTNKSGVWNDIQDMGYTYDLDEITFAPGTGWSDLGYVEVITGHTYVIWTWDYHYAKLRVTNKYTDYITFEWAYQTAPNNQELKPVPKKPR
ncbi:MAG: hypothetical protein Q8O10_10670 [candidate division Zixibacteria bacterium]|nr:hypothetical protein [candidate division Zixibacteria bacterium]